MSAGRAVAATTLTVIVSATLFAPILAPHDPHEQFAHFPYAPPMRPHVIDRDGRWRMPFVYPLRLVDRLERRYVEEQADPVPIADAWRSKHQSRGAALVFLFGTDALGRDLLSRLLLGARASLGIAAAATAGALVIGVLLGAIAGYSNGAVDEVAMRAAEMILVLPALYVVLALRSAMPLVLEPRQVFVGVAGVLAVVGWPVVARGVRAIVSVECHLDYVEAARACGSSPTRLVLRHILPAARGFIRTQAALLVPAFAIAEATLSFAGFGFAEPTPSWGTMLQEAGNVRLVGEHPWLLAPAVAIAAVSWAMHSVVRDADAGDVRYLAKM